MIHCIMGYIRTTLKREICRSHMWLTLLFLLCAVSANAKDTPTLTFSTSEYSVLISHKSFQKPSVSLKVGNKNVRRYFFLRYSFADGTDVTSSVDNDGHIIYTDKTTGTTVNNFTGDVTIGDDPTASGQPLKVKVTATPSILYYDSYETVSATYSITISSPDVSAYTISVPNVLASGSDKTQSVDKALSLITTKNEGKVYSSTISLNTANIGLTYSSGYSIDVRDYFSVSFEDVSDADAKGLTYAYDADNKNVLNVESSYVPSDETAKSSVTQKLKLTFKPKDDASKKRYGDISISFTINIGTSYYPFGSSEKVKTYLVFPNREEGWYRSFNSEPFTAPYDPQDPKVYDENGNDVTSYYDLAASYNWTVTPLNSYKYSDNPFDKGTNFKSDDGKSYAENYPDYTQNNTSTWLYAIYGKDNAQMVRPDDYVITCTVPLKAQYNLAADPVASILATNPSIEGANGEADQTVVKGQFYYLNQDDSVHINPGQYVLHVYKLAPELTLTPDPSSISIAENYEMNKGNRFKIKGFIHDPYRNVSDSTVFGSDSYRGFDYSMFVPDELLWDSINPQAGSGIVKIEVCDSASHKDYVYVKKDKTLTDVVNYGEANAVKDADGNIQVLWAPAGVDNKDHVIPHIWMRVQELDENGKPKYDADGDPVTTLKRGTIFISKTGWGNDNTSVYFHGTGTVTVYYNTVPHNPARWDLSAYTGKMFHVVEKQPVVLVVDPTKYVIRKGETAPEPSVKVWDMQFNIDLTKYYKYTWAKQTDEHNVITFDAKKHTSYGNEVGGPIEIKIDALARQDTTSSVYSYGMYNDVPNNSPGKYTVQVINNRVLFDVIYDKSYYETTDGTTIKTDGNGKNIPGEYDNTTTTKMGKLHFVDDGTTDADKIDGVGLDFTPGQSASDGTLTIPGLEMTFGSANDADNWKVFDAAKVTGANHDATDDALDDYTGDGTNKRVIDLLAGAVMFAKSDTVTNADNMVGIFGNDSCYVPVTGGFLKLMPTTNGFLQIDAHFGTKSSSVSYYLVDAADTKHAADRAVRPTTDALGNAIADDTQYYGESKFPFALLEGHTYYLFSDGENFHMHGLTFMPAFVVMHEDNAPAKSATVFVNSPWIGDLPMLVNDDKTTKSGDPQPGDVNFTLTFNDDDWSASKDVQQVGSSTLVNKKASDLVSIKNGYQIVGTGFSFKNRVRVRGSVIGKSKKYSSEVVERAPYMDVASTGIPIYKVAASHEGLFPGTRVTTTNFVTRMWMTWGGWTQDDQVNYPYSRLNKGKVETFIDSWNNAKSDTVGRDNMTIDGFKFASNADNNPFDENVKAFSSYGVRGYFNSSDMSGTSGVYGKSKFKHIKVDPFNVPVRGDYVKFEPDESGTLMVYLLQNGMTDLDNNRPSDHLSGNPWELRRRSVYIVDETGSVVQLDPKNDDWTSSDAGSIGGAFAENTGRHSAHYNYMTEGLLRCTWTGTPGNPLTINNIADTFNIAKRWASEYPLGKDDPDLKADIDSVYAAWKNAEFNSIQEVIRLKDGSFAIPTKAYTRYTFDVKAGKTYYVFMNGSKLGICGFAFIPVGFMQHAESWPECKEGGFGLTAKDSVARANLPEPYSETNNIYSTTDASSGHKDINLIESTPASDSTDNHDPDAGESGHASAADGVDKLEINFVNVKLDRSFTNKEWTSICLPFSVNEQQVKKLFGDNVQVITFDSVMTNHKEIVRVDANYDPNDSIYGDSIGYRSISVAERTAHFTKHVTQDIIAGKPYFISPGWTDAQMASTSNGEPYAKEGTTVGRKNLVFKHVSFEATPAKTDTCWNYSVWLNNDLVASTKSSLEKKRDAETVQSKKDSIQALINANDTLRKNIFNYSFVGIYDRQQVPWYSYVMASNDEGNGLWRVVPKSGNETDNRPYLKGFRAYLYPASVDIDGDTIVNNDGSTTPPLATTTGAKVSSLWLSGAEVFGDTGAGGVTGIDAIVEQLNQQLTIGRKGVWNVAGQLVRKNDDLTGLPAGVYIMNGEKYLIK